MSILAPRSSSGSVDTRDMSDSDSEEEDDEGGGGGEDELEGEETHLVRAILIEKITVLPRQARDKHRKSSTQKR